MTTDTTNDYKNVNAKEQALKRLYELSLKSIESLRDIPELDELSYEQEQWLKEKRFHK